MDFGVELMLIRPLPYFLKWYFPAKEPAPGLGRIKLIQGAEVLLRATASLKTALPLSLTLLG